MRRVTVALAGPILLTSLCALAPAAAATPSVHTVAAGLSAPGGIAVDRSGDVFVADTNHCRVVLVPARSGVVDGLHVRAHHNVTLAGAPCGTKGSLAYPSGVAVDPVGDVFVAEATAQRVVLIRPSKPHVAVPFAGTGQAGFNGNGMPATAAELDEPTGVAVNSASDLFIADTANCVVRVVPHSTGVMFGQKMTAGSIYSVAGTGTCGSADRSGPAGLAQLWGPVAIAVDEFDDLYIADAGDQSVLEVPVHGGYYYDTVVGGTDMATIVGGNGNGPYLSDGLSATGPVAELNDPEGVAVSPTGTLFITDGAMHCIRVVPLHTADVLGRSMSGGDLYTLAGEVPITVNSAQPGNGSRWVLTHMGVPVGVAVTASGAVLYSDRTDDVVRQIG